MVAAILIALVLILAAITGLYEYSRKHRPYPDGFRPRHAVGTGQAPRHARDAFADPRDVLDPDGAVWLAQVRAAQPPAPLKLAPHFHHEDRGVYLDTLARVKAGLLALPVAGELDMLPPDPPAADTGELPHAVGTWGKTAKELADELAAQHLGSDEEAAA